MAANWNALVAGAIYYDDPYPSRDNQGDNDDPRVDGRSLIF